MNINPAAAYGLYKANSVKSVEAESAPVKVEAAPKNENTDTISISTEATQRLEAGRIARSIASQLEPPSDPAKIQAIREAVEDGTYFVPTDKLASAILSRWAGL